MSTKLNIFIRYFSRLITIVTAFFFFFLNVGKWPNLPEAEREI